MKLFNLKARKENKMKVELIRNIEEVERKVSNANMFVISNTLNRIINIIDDSNVKLDAYQINMINNELNVIKKYSSKVYDELLKNKCNSIIAIIKRDKISLDSNKAAKENDERIYRLLGDQKELIRQIEETTSKMNEVLGKDKYTWQLLNMKRKTLLSRVDIIAKNYSTVLSAQSNLMIANEVRQAKEEAEAILNQANLVDAGEFEDNANYITQTNDEVANTSMKINDSFARNFGANNDGSEYEKALEQMTMENNERSRIEKSQQLDRK